MWLLSLGYLSQVGYLGINVTGGGGGGGGGGGDGA